MIKLFSILIVLCISLINGQNQISTYNIPLKLNNTFELVLNRHVRQASTRNAQINGTVNALASTEGVAQTGPINIKIRYFIDIIILKSYSFIIIIIKNSIVLPEIFKRVEEYYKRKEKHHKKHHNYNKKTSQKINYYKQAKHLLKREK